MSTQCNRFVQNAWKKELCSNCFKLREEHAPPEETLKLNIGRALHIVKTDSVKIQVSRSLGLARFSETWAGYILVCEEKQQVSILVDLNTFHNFLDSRLFLLSFLVSSIPFSG